MGRPLTYTQIHLRTDSKHHFADPKRLIILAA